MGKQTREQQLELKEKCMKLKEDKIKKEKELRLLRDKYFAKMEQQCTLLRHAEELRKEQIELLQKTFTVTVEKEVELRLRQIKEEMLVLNNQLEQTAGNENAAVASHEVGSSRDEQTEHRMLENELCCGVCSELIVFATTLNCMHTFCCYCIKQWKKTKVTCPVCRKGISSEERNYLVDNVVNIVAKFQAEEEKNYRKELVQQHKELIENIITEPPISTFSTRLLPHFSANVSENQRTPRTPRATNVITFDEWLASEEVAQIINAPEQVSHSTSVSRPPLVSDSFSSVEMSIMSSESSNSPASASGVRPRVAGPTTSSVRPRVRRLQSATRGTERPRWR